VNLADKSENLEWRKGRGGGGRHVIDHTGRQQRCDSHISERGSGPVQFVGRLLEARPSGLGIALAAWEVRSETCFWCVCVFVCVSKYHQPASLQKDQIVTLTRDWRPLIEGQGCEPRWEAGHATGGVVDCVPSVASCTQEREIVKQDERLEQDKSIENCLFTLDDCDLS
jgi:hypothetical protein